MIRLLSAKLFSYLSFHRFTLLHLGLIVLLSYAASQLTLNIQGSVDLLHGLFARPAVWRTIVGLSRWLLYIPAFFVIQLVCAEFELKVVRAQVIAGLERWQIVLSWVVQNLLLVTCGLITTIACGLVLGYASIEQADVGVASSLLSLLRAELGYLIYGMAFLNAAVLSGVLLRRPVPAIMLLVLWPLLIEPVLTFTLEHKQLAAVVPYLPFASLGTLVTWHDASTAFDPFALTTWVALAYGLAAVLAAGLLLERADL